ncbi:MAG: hypothetical protein ACK5I7_08420 [Anaerotignum sp.]
MDNFTLGFCLWDIPAAIAFAVSLLLLIVQKKKYKDRMSKLKSKNK